MPFDPSSFLVLSAEHERLAEIFAAHQDALLRLDTLGALERLVEFEADLRLHMRAEEDLLLPLYEREPREARYSASVFTVEHRRMVRMIDRSKDEVRSLGGGPADLRRGVVRILDDESLFKRLVEHHNAREERVLYPILDRITASHERAELLRRCIATER